MQQHCIGVIMRKLIIDVDTINAIINSDSNVNSNTSEDNKMDNTAIDMKRELANKYFAEACQILGVKYDAKVGKYRDTGSGRFVSVKTMWDTSVGYDHDLEYDFLDNPTGIKEVDPTDNTKEPKDALGDLPDWDSMSDEAVLASCIYMKKQVLGDGRIVKRPLMQATLCEDGEVRSMPIPVRRASDGNEYGYNHWGKQTPEDMYLTRATKAAEYLIEWDQEWLIREQLDNEINRLKAGLVTSGHLHPYQDGEDIIQAMLLRQAEKKLAKIKVGKQRLIKLLKKEKAAKIWAIVKNEVEILVQETTWPGDDFMEVSEKIQRLQKAIITHVNGMLESWEEIPGFGRVATGGGMTKEAWIEISTAISTFAWGSVTGSLNPEVKGALWCTAARYVSNMLALEMLEVLAENNSVDRQTEAIVGEKTPMNEFFQKEELDWAWNSRVLDWEDMPRGWLGRLPWQDKVGAEKIED